MPGSRGLTATLTQALLTVFSLVVPFIGTWTGRRRSQERDSRTNKVEGEKKTFHVQQPPGHSRLQPVKVLRSFRDDDAHARRCRSLTTPPTSSACSTAFTPSVQHTPRPVITPFFALFTGHRMPYLDLGVLLADLPGVSSAAPGRWDATT